MAKFVSCSEINFDIFISSLRCNNDINIVYTHFKTLENDGLNITNTYSANTELTEEIKKNICTLIETYMDSLSYHMEYCYKKKNRFEYYKNLLAILPLNSIEDFITKDVFIKLLENITKCMYGQQLLKKLDKEFLDTRVFTSYRRLSYIGVSEGTLPTFLYWFNMLDKSQLTNDYMHDILTSGFGNTDDRIYKYLINNNLVSKFLSGSETIIWSIIRHIMTDKIPTKYQLRRLRALSQYNDLSIHINDLIGSCNDFNTLTTILKYYYTNTDADLTKDFYDNDYFGYTASIYNIIVKICGNINDTTEYLNLKDIFQILKSKEDKFIFMIHIFLNNSTIYDFNIQGCNLSKSKQLFLLNIVLKSGLISITNSIKYNKSFSDIMQMFDSNIIKICLNSNNYAKILSENILFVLFPYIKYVPESAQNYLLLNKCLFYMRTYIRKKVTHRKIYNHIRILPILKELQDVKSTKPVFKKIYNGYNIKKQKFNYVPPYHLFPGELDNIKYPLYFREKADGVLVKNLPINICPYHNLTENIKAEYIEDLDLYLVFDVDINMSIEDRYNYLRNSHPYTKKTDNCIYSFDELINSIKKERDIFNRFLSLPYTNYRWYPKAAWKLVNLNTNKIFLESLYKFINNTSSDNIFSDWLCFNSPVKNDGLIITPLDGSREIKLKPKDFMTIDLLYKDGKWLDRNEEDNYNEIITLTDISKDNLGNNNIWRCYPVNGKFTPREIRFDKIKPNPNSIVNTIIHLHKITYIPNKPKLYYTKNNINYGNITWSKIIKENQDIIKKHITNYNSNTSWLDLGCGKGKLLKYLNNYTSYYGIDFDCNVLAKANHTFNSEKNTFNYLDLANNWNDTIDKWSSFNYNKRFDIIIAINSIMHFFTESFWEQLNKVVKTNSRFIFNIVNDKSKEGFTMDSNTSYIKVEGDVVKYKFNPVHNSEMTERFISQKELYSTIKKYNWEIINTYTSEEGLPSLYTWYTLNKL